MSADASGDLSSVAWPPVNEDGAQEFFVSAHLHGSLTSCDEGTAESWLGSELPPACSCCSQREYCNSWVQAEHARRHGAILRTTEILVCVMCLDVVGATCVSVHTEKSVCHVDSMLCLRQCEALSSLRRGTRCCISRHRACERHWSVKPHARHRGDE